MRDWRANKVYPRRRGPGRWPSRPLNTWCSSRWGDWALSLGERHTRVGICRRGLSLILAERWQLVTQAFYPRIHLAIGPLVFPKWSQTTPQFMSIIQPNLILTTGGNVEAMATGTLNEGMHNTNEPARPEVGPSALTGRSSSKNWGEAFQLPLVRIFARATAEDQTAETKGLRFETLVVQHSLHFAKRVVDGRLRHEQPQRVVFTLSHHGIPRPVSKPTQDERVAERQVKAATTGEMDLRGPWSLDIEQLTDRVVRSIDGRILAHRERIGTVY